MERTPERSHGGATGFQPPAGVKLNRIPAEESIGTMMMEGKLDATLLYLTDNNLVDRSRIEFEGNPKVRYLFPDRAAEGKRYFRKTGIFPINHGMVVRRSVYEKNPWVALNVFNAFRLAKEQVADRIRSLASTHVELGLVPDGTKEGLQVDAYPYGVKSNLKVLETVCQYSHEQGLTPRLVGLDEIFAPSTMDL
jgi:4,5-dihydroxyphthalate decarboxylase